ncbi:MAG TPA: hypothetical protein VHM94_16245 [Acidimicrobiia bacterium]|jgi:hypothetical protein|nr:hypothetical protein [Acidimicrobiia bacterium]
MSTDHTSTTTEAMFAAYGLQATEVFSGDGSACPHCAARVAVLAA